MIYPIFFKKSKKQHIFLWKNTKNTNIILDFSFMYSVSVDPRINKKAFSIWSHPQKEKLNSTHDTKFWIKQAKSYLEESVLWFRISVQLFCKFCRYICNLFGMFFFACHLVKLGASNDYIAYYNTCNFKNNFLQPTKCRFFFCQKDWSYKTTFLIWVNSVKNRLNLVFRFIHSFFFLFILW